MNTCSQKVILRAVLWLMCTCPVLFNASRAGAESGTERAGDVLQIVIPATAFGAALCMHDAVGQRQFVKSLVVELGVVYTLKYSIHKNRPEHNGGHSFPSGHTAAAFQGASFIQRRYGWRYSVPAYLGAAFVGWSRVEGESDKHDATDVIAGAAIGILSSRIFTTSLGGRAVNVTAVASDGMVGCCIGVAW